MRGEDEAVGDKQKKKQKKKKQREEDGGGARGLNLDQNYASPRNKHQVNQAKAQRTEAQHAEPRAGR